MRLKHALFLPVVLCLAVTGCAGKKEQKAETEKTVAAAEEETRSNDAALPEQTPVETLYNDALAKLNGGTFLDAARAFEDVDREYPYSPWAKRAQLMSGYAYYKDLRYDEAVLSLDRFIELHPGDAQIAYAYYLKALCFYEQISDVRRDQQMTELALDNLRVVSERFPDSPYARDARLKMDLTQDHLAGKEMEIGRYYLERKQYQSAINRFQTVMTDYQTTTHVPEALLRLTEAYVSLGLLDEARKSTAVLGHNYPESSWYRDAYRLMGGKLDDAPPEPAKKSLYDRTLGTIF
jgi:outer membrane protein assembly factor BamD